MSRDICICSALAEVIVSASHQRAMRLCAAIGTAPSMQGTHAVCTAAAWHTLQLGVLHVCPSPSQAGDFRCTVHSLRPSNSGFSTRTGKPHIAAIGTCTPLVELREHELSMLMPAPPTRGWPNRLICHVEHAGMHCRTSCHEHWHPCLCCREIEIILYWSFALPLHCKQ
jgi:hypothetical protein